MLWYGVYMSNALCILHCDTRVYAAVWLVCHPMPACLQSCRRSVCFSIWQASLLWVFYEVQGQALTYAYVDQSTFAKYVRIYIVYTQLAAVSRGWIILVGTVCCSKHKLVSLLLVYDGSQPCIRARPRVRCFCFLACLGAASCNDGTAAAFQRRCTLPGHVLGHSNVCIAFGLQQLAVLLQG
jgi:hypothetical protein